MRSYFIYMHSYAIRMSVVCTRMSSVCHSYVPACHPYVTRMYSYVIRMSLVCTRMSYVCHPYVLVCHPYVPCMSSVCHSYVLVCHPYVTRMWFYHEPYLTTKTLNFKSLVQNMFLQKETSHCRNISVKFLAISFTRKMSESSDSMHSSMFMLENVWYCNFALSIPNSEEIVNFVPVVGPKGPN